MAIEVEIDSRVCVKQQEGGFKMDRQDIGLEDTREVLQRILFYMRACEMKLVSLDVQEFMDSFVIHEDEPTDTPKVCIAWNAETRQIQAAVTGLDMWQACVLLDNAVAYINAIIMKGAE